MESSKNAYDIAYERATNPETREDFWREYVDKIEWNEKPQKILDQSNPPFYRWFKDGKLNICHNAIDRWAKVQPDKPALIWESNMEHKNCSYTWTQLLEKVSKLAYILHKLGVKTGDRVIIYMPMIPEAIFAKLACARIGAIHSVVFGGFAAKELASRIQDAKPKLIICASCGLEPHKVIIIYLYLIYLASASIQNIIDA
jgi:propionyl-CoA synthetase